jgi:hypothetical protein
VIGSKSDKKFLEEWRANIGEEAADEITRVAGLRGTAIHEMAEKLLMNDPDYWKGYGTINVHDFNRVIPILNTHVTKVLGLEVPLWSHRLKTAGRTDVVCEWDQMPSIVDFKTARKFKFKNQIEGYFIQAAVYAIMFEEVYGVRVPQIVVIILVDHKEKPCVYVEETKDWFKKVREYFLGNESGQP